VRFSTDFPLGSASAHGWLDPAGVTDFARCLEAAGFAGLGFTDHPAPSGKWLDHGGHETFDPFAALAFCAAATTQIRLLTNLLVVPYRNPLVQARSMMTVDVLSGGRAIFVLGTGYLRSEFAAVGVEFERRNELFDESIEVITAYFSGEDLVHDGPSFTAHGQRLRPLPVQRPYPPLWLGGNSRVARDRLARWGQGWSVLMASPEMAKTSRTPAITTVEELAVALDDVAERALAAGRSIDDIEVMTASPVIGVGTGASVERQLEELGRLAEIGVSWVQVHIPPGAKQETLDGITEFGESVVSAS